jgi:hypothetical protein
LTPADDAFAGTPATVGAKSGVSPTSSTGSTTTTPKPKAPGTGTNGSTL